LTTIFAAGNATQFPSFLQKSRVRTQDVKYNCEAAAFAAMQMLDKRHAIFRYIPMTNLRIGERQLYFIGERENAFTEIIISGDINSNKFVVFYVTGDEVTGILTSGF